MGPYHGAGARIAAGALLGALERPPEAEFTVDAVSCAMESAIYVSDTQQTGHVSMTHQYLRSASLHPLRFARWPATVPGRPHRQQATPA
jgi:serine protease Do